MDREFVDLAAVHFQVVHFLRQRLGGGRVQGTAGGNVQERRPFAVRTQMEALHADAGVFIRHQHGRARAIAEKDAGVAIGVIDDAREGLSADHQDFFECAVLNELAGGGEGIDEAGAGRVDIECPDVSFNAEVVLHETGDGRGHHVGRECADDDEVEFLRLHLRFGQSMPGRFGRQRGGGFPRSGDATFQHAGALDDPVAGGVDHFFKVGIGQPGAPVALPVPAILAPNRDI